MPRTALHPVVAAAICVLVVGLAAATLTTAVDVSQYDPDPDVRGDQSSEPVWDFDIDRGDGPESGPSAETQFQLVSMCIPFLLSPAFYALAAVGLVGLFVAVSRKLAPEYGLIALLGVAPIGLILHSWVTNCAAPTYSAGFSLPTSGEGSNVSNVSQQPGTTGPDNPLFAIVLGVGVVALVLAVVFTRLRTQPVEPEPEPEPEVTEPLSGVASAAGEAVERIGETPSGLENEVFRTWRVMTDHLDVPNPESSTPAEFAAAAREAGMGPADVDALTDLFREVRYGGEEPTLEREEHAQAILRKIERRYSEDGEIDRRDGAEGDDR